MKTASLALCLLCTGCYQLASIAEHAVIHHGEYATDGKPDGRGGTIYELRKIGR